MTTFTAGGVTKVGTAPIQITYTSPSGDVIVRPGAMLTSPTTPAHVGGRIALIAPNVTNQGTISTADGQTIIAAGRQVGFAEHSSDDPTLRGLNVFVGTADGQSGIARNSGLIDAPRASVILAGREVNQSGVIDSSTSVTLNGRIDLLANYGAVPNPKFDPDARRLASISIHLFRHGGIGGGECYSHHSGIEQCGNRGRKRTCAAVAGQCPGAGAFILRTIPLCWRPMPT